MNTKFGKAVDKDLGNAIEFLVSPLGTIWSASGFVIFGGMMYFALNTGKWSAVRNESRGKIDFLQGLLDDTPVENETRRRQIIVEMELQKRFRRETWFKMFNPPNSSPEVDYASIWRK